LGLFKDIYSKVGSFYKIYEAFEKHFQRNGGFNKKSEAFSKITRLFEDIFHEIKAFNGGFFH
jgi:hypothetical protein